MTPHELLEQGQLKDTLTALTQAVRTNPADPHLRTFLFEALCFDGSLERAAKQLDVLAAQASAGGAIACQIYRSLLDAETARRRVFAGEAMPVFAATPPDWIEPVILQLSHIARQSTDLAAAAERAETMAPTFSGRLNGQPFTEFRDADDRLAHVFEVFRGSDYVWLPFSLVRKIELTEPVRLRDLLWTHGKVETTDNQSGDFYLPALYPGSHAHDQDQVRLGRSTAWSAIGDAVLCGAGQRIFVVDGADVPFLEIRTIEFDLPGASH